LYTTAVKPAEEKKMKAAAREIPTQNLALGKNSQRTLVVEECFPRKFVINDPLSS